MSTWWRSIDAAAAWRRATKLGLIQMLLSTALLLCVSAKACLPPGSG